jgi:hypothetical protein
MFFPDHNNLFIFGFFGRDNVGMELAKSQLVEELTLLRNKMEVLENDYEKQTIALEEERKKMSHLLVNNKFTSIEVSSYKYTSLNLHTLASTDSIPG